MFGLSFASLACRQNGAPQQIQVREFTRLALSSNARKTANKTYSPRYPVMIVAARGARAVEGGVSPPGKSRPKPYRAIATLILTARPTLFQILLKNHQNQVRCSTSDDST